MIPDSVPESSFRIKGNSSSFHITWSPSTKVEWGTVFYCVGSKALQVRVSMQSLPSICMYYCVYLLIHLFLKRNGVCFFSSIYKLVKSQIANRVQVVQFLHHYSQQWLWASGWDVKSQARRSQGSKTSEKASHSNTETELPLR